ncbi:MAG: hypothetical protein JW918_08000 [Anaerolineae bacterium]|nr:hypothetical protein [Anaerolineae bacterium]
MSKSEQPDVVFEQFEQAGPDIKMLASQVRAVKNPGVRDTLLRAIRVLMGKPADSAEAEDEESP